MQMFKVSINDFTNLNTQYILEGESKELCEKTCDQLNYLFGQAGLKDLTCFVESEELMEGEE